MIFKSQIKHSCCCPVLAGVLHPFPKNPAGIGPQNNKRLTRGKNEVAVMVPTIRSCTKPEQGEKRVTLSQMESGLCPPFGIEDWGQSRNKRRVRGTEKGTLGEEDKWLTK